MENLKIGGENVNVFKRFRAAMRLIFNKSDRETIELNNLYKFLGIDPDTDDKVLSEATYYACQKILSEALGKLPLKLLRFTEKNGVVTMRKHYLYHILHDRPNPYMTATSFWSTVEYNRNHYGNAYVWIQGAGKKMKLWILPSNQVEVWYDDAKILPDQPDIFYLYSAGGKVYKFGSEEILHFKSSNTLDGIVGISVQDQLKSTINGSIKSQKLLNKMYESGFTAKAVLQYTGSLSDENVATFVKGIESYAKGELREDGVENIIPIPLGSTLTPLNVKLADNQFIEVKYYTSAQIAAAFGIKPYQYNDLTKSSYASAEAQQLSFYVDTLLYIIKQYEEELNYKLLSPDEIAQGYHFKFNVGVILRADLKTQIETLVKAINGGLYKANEARALMDLEWVDGGDTLLVNGTSIPINMIGMQYVNQPEKPPEDNKPEEDPPEENNEEGGKENE
jgi:HK97 family phage portal protein